MQKGTVEAVPFIYRLRIDLKFGRIRLTVEKGMNAMKKADNIAS